MQSATEILTVTFVDRQTGPFRTMTIQPDNIHPGTFGVSAATTEFTIKFEGEHRNFSGYIEQN